MTLFNMMKRSKPRSSQGRTKSGHNNSDFKPKAANVKQNLDKYLGLARESMAVGDRIAAEGYYQHAEHYLRLMNEIKAQQPAAEPAFPKPLLDEVKACPESELSPTGVIAAELACETTASTEDVIIETTAA